MVFCDFYGIVKFWDVRIVVFMVSFDVGLYLVNRVVFDFIGVVVVIVSNDVIVKMYEVFNGRVRIVFICFFND